MRMQRMRRILRSTSSLFDNGFIGKRQSFAVCPNMPKPVCQAKKGVLVDAGMCLVFLLLWIKLTEKHPIGASNRKK